MADGENPGKRRKVKPETNTYIEAPMNAHSGAPMNAHTEAVINSHKEARINALRETPEFNGEALERDSHKEVPVNVLRETPEFNGEAPERDSHRKVPEIIAYKEKLEQIANFFDNKQGNSHSRPSRPNDTEWRLQRVYTIRILKEFREKLDMLSVRPSSEKSLINSAESEGAAGSIIGTAKSLFGLSCNPWVTSIGNSLTSIPLVSSIGRLVNETGTGISKVSKEIESQMSEKYLRKIEAALEEDRTLTRPLAEWLNLSYELDTMTQEIFGVSLISVTFNSVVKVFHGILKLFDCDRSFDDILSLLEQEKYSAYNGDFVKAEKLEKFYQCLSAFPKLADRIRCLFSTLCSQSEDLHVLIRGVQTYRSIMGTSSSTGQGGCYPEKASTTTSGEICVLQTIKLALSVISLINAASIIRRGTSQYSEPLKQLISSLTWELERIENS